MTNLTCLGGNFTKLKTSLTFISLFILGLNSLQAQENGVIRGQITNKQNNNPVPYATVSLEGTTYATQSDSNGVYVMRKIKNGFYNVNVTSIGFKKKTQFDVQINNARPAIIDFELEEEIKSLKEAVIRSSPFSRSDESPVSLKNIGVAEIQRNPGGNRDISRTIQSLPGVASGVAFRNDIIIRGGAPSENRFYLDAVEVPTINHFSTQGASGGPVGIINVDLIREVDFYSGAFPANRGNTLSSIFEFKQKEARTDKVGYRFILSATDVSLLAEGPLSKKTTFLFSARRSYLQLLFSAIGLPFLPTYNGFQMRIKHKIDQKNEIYFVGLGAYDQFRLNTGLNLSLDPTQNPGVDTERVEQQQYILGYLPVNNQWNYTNGLVYKHYTSTGAHLFVLSRNMLDNRAFKYQNNDAVNGRKLLDFGSQEIENKFRYEHNFRTKSGFRVIYGINAQYARFLNNTFQVIPVRDSLVTFNFNSAFDLWSYGAFGNISKRFIKDRLTIAAGFRADGNGFNTKMGNPLNQFSPRLSFSYAITDKINFNANTGIYYQLPSYTILGFINNQGQLVNKNVDYLKSTHYVAGLEYLTGKSLRVTVEGFYKQYANMPQSLLNGIPLANLGGDFGVIGNEPVSSTAAGRSYGMEVLIQQRLYKGLYGILSYTYVRSEFDNKGTWIPSAWDNRHILSFTGAKMFKKGWEVGARYRFFSGTPYTPYDTANSMLISNWQVRNQAGFNFNQLNTLRNGVTSVLDIRIDKKWTFNKIGLDLYLDIQNVLNFKTQTQPILDVVRDSSGNPIPNPNQVNSYQARFVPNPAGQRLPTIGIVVDF